jgi:heavy metal sensor kinase
MKSVRFSLLLYFAVLLALVLGAVSVLAYRQAGDSLKERQRTIEEMLNAKYQERRREEQDRLDKSLLADARNLAGLVQVQVKVPRVREPVWCALGLLTSGLAPSGYCACPLWVAETVPGPVGYQVRMLSLTPQLRQLVLPADTEEKGNDQRYFQINLRNGTEWRSRSLGNYAFPFVEPELFPDTPVVDWHFDDTEMPPGQPVRRVTLRVSRFRVSFQWPAKGPKGQAKVPPPAAQAPREWTLYIQAAAPTAARDAALARFRSELDAERARAEEESNEGLQALRTRLLVIALLAFAAALVGGLWLVWLGLRPLRRLGEAVSRVSEKDFRLPLDPAGLPEELRPIADRLAQTLEQLRRAFAREKQAAADISHELRTPLASLLASLDVALRKPRSAEEYRRVLEECRTTGEQMGELVERLLALARLDAGAAQVRPRPVDAVELAEQCAALVRPLAEARGLSLNVHHDGPLPVTTDPDKLREVLTNLLHNAIEYNRPQGRVDLTIQRAARRLRLQVRDTGIGIAPEVREHIFERFYRADPSRQSDGMHAGIGLAIVKGYVDLLGGTIDLESTVGQGTIFTITLPADKEWSSCEPTASADA